MDEKSLNLWRQIERCRRTANMTTSDDVRHSLDHLADEREAKIPARRDGFMLGAAPGQEQPQPAVKRATSR